jgi:MFS transporter, LPLT family, lysophospholipid transporter
MPLGFYRLIAAQFISALADNALMIVVMALLQQQGSPAWWVPFLKFSLTSAYVVLAPFVGPLADAFLKSRVMMAMNALKVLGALAMLGGLHPVLAFAIIGVGAAVYAPAKYGLVTELVPAQRLVAANSWIEVSTVGAVLMGAVLGGVLISAEANAALAALSKLTELSKLTAFITPWWPASNGPTAAPTTVQVAITLLLLVYATAAFLNVRLPDSGVRYRRTHRAPLALWRSFWRGQRRLWQDPEGGLSMAVTTLFWGAAAVLQFAVLRWSVDVLGLSLDRAAYLQAVVAVGIVVGAGVAGHCVPLAKATRVLPLGVLMGVLVPLVGWVDTWPKALPLLLLVGALGGALVVPLNALLQHRGQQLLTAGRSIAVQNFNENLSMLCMLAIYAALLAWQVRISTVMSVLGLFVAGVVACLMWQQRQAIGSSTSASTIASTSARSS